MKQKEKAVEQINLYQQGDKTTIVVYHLKEKTKKELFRLLLQDFGEFLGECEEIRDLVPPEPDAETAADVSGMTNIKIASLMQNLGNNPKALIFELGKLRISGTDDEKEAAGEAMGCYLTEIAEKAEKWMKEDILYSFCNLDTPGFKDCLKQILVQKGFGRDRESSPDYPEAVKAAVSRCTDEELAEAISFIARKYYL